MKKLLVCLVASLSYGCATTNVDVPQVEVTPGATEALSAAVKTTANTTANPTANATTAQELVAFRDPTLSVDERVADLVGRLTLQEKVAQMYDKAPSIQRLGIPRYEWWNEALHGVARAGTATVFPQAIGLAASFDEELVLDVAQTISVEARAKHQDFVSRGTRSMYTGLTFWSPNINIFRDPRWGRGQETYGEDPFLTARIATNFVRGLQGADSESPDAVATLKHYAVHSGPEPTRHSDNFNPSKYDLRATYLQAFERVIANTDVQSVMCSYNAVYGEPACASPYLLDELLRKEFGFTGYVVSDCGAIADVYKVKAHRFTSTKEKAAAVSVAAGTDLECGDGDGSAYLSLVSAVRNGLIEETLIDQAVTRLFKARLRLGLLGLPTQAKSMPSSLIGAPAHLELALEAAKKAFVLLKNDGILPLKESARIALIGPNANNPDVLTANYHGQPVSPITPLAALDKRLGSKLSYAVGSSLAGEMYTHYEKIPASLFQTIEGESRFTGLQAEFFDNADLKGRPSRTTPIESIDFQWQVSPVTGREDDDFSVRFSGMLLPEVSGRYRFGGGLAVSIDGQKVEGEVSLEAGTSYLLVAEKQVGSAWHSNAIQPEAVLTWLNVERNLMQEAVDAVKDADVIVYAGGISSRLEGEEMKVEIEGFSGGDRTSIDLPSSQRRLLQRLRAQGKPIVFVNFSGSAIDLSWAKENAAAVIQGFYPGEATGEALTQLLLGDYSPSGRLPVTFYSSVTDLPPFESYVMQGRTYKYYKGSPVYPFGAGMGYSSFGYQLKKAPKSLRAGKDLLVKVKIENLGSLSADHVVQLYVEPVAGQSHEIRELKAFAVANIAAGEKTDMVLRVPASDLVFIDDDGSDRPYSGDVAFRVGGLSSGAPHLLFKVRF